MEQVCSRSCDPIGGLTLEQSVPEGLHLLEGIHSGAVREEQQPVGRIHAREDRGVCLPLEEEKKVKHPSPRAGRNGRNTV